MVMPVRNVKHFEEVLHKIKSLVMKVLDEVDSKSTCWVTFDVECYKFEPDK